MSTLTIITDQVEPVILCGYRNQTPGIQIARIRQHDRIYSERVIFPYDWLLVEASADAYLEIDENSPSSGLRTTIACSALQVPC
jgi:hypothetical protein